MRKIIDGELMCNCMYDPPLHKLSDCSGPEAAAKALAELKPIDPLTAVHDFLDCVKRPA